MAVVDAFRGADILVKLSTDGGTTHIHYCSVNSSRGVTLNTETTTQNLPDCDNPFDPSWQSMHVTAKSVSVSGAGMAHKPDIAIFSDLWNGGTKIPAIVEVGGTGGVSFSGEFIISSISWTGERLENAEFDISFESDGEIIIANIP